MKIEKCGWKVREVKYLGVVIRPEKIELVTYYRQFVKDFAFIARLLYNLVKKE